MRRGLKLTNTVRDRDLTFRFTGFPDEEGTEMASKHDRHF